jgi:uncharacterized membrane protein
MFFLFFNMNYFVDIGIILLFLIAICIAKKYNKLNLLIYSSIFALIFENLNILLFHNSSGGYFYATNFLMIFKVPLFVILSWGIIILTSFIISEKITNNKFKQIFLIPIFAVILDLGFESSAVANNLWIWKNEIYNGFLTIPAENFIGWLLVSFSFAIIYLYLNEKLKFLSTFLSYILFILFSIIPFTISEIFKLNNIGKIILFFIMFISFIFIGLKNIKLNKNLKINKEYYVIILLRLPFYIFPLIYLNSWINDIYSIIIFILMIIIEITIHIYIIKFKKLV